MSDIKTEQCVNSSMLSLIKFKVHDIIYFDRFFCEWIDAASKSMRAGKWSCIQGFPWLVPELETTPLH